VRYRDRDGQSIWFEVTHSNLLNDQAHRVVRSEMVDVSERMDAVERLRAGEQLLRRLTEALPLGVVQIDANRTIVYAASIGVAWTDAAVGCDTIVALADEAMYETKRVAGGLVLALHRARK
jgi:PAS domain-containing protein